MIKWMRLRRIAKRIVGRPVNIHGSTTLDTNLKAAVKSSEDLVDVAVNFGHIKTLEDTIRALAHELAHVKLDSTEHGEEFNREWDKITKEITDEYSLKDSI